MRRALAAAALLALAGGCGGGGTSSGDCANAAFIAYRQNADAPHEVTVCGSVMRVSHARTRSGRHEYLDLQVSGTIPVRVIVNEDEEGPVSAHSGSSVLAHGRYFNDGDRDGIDWTHHGAGRSWPYPGYLVVDGQRYQ